MALLDAALGPGESTADAKREQGEAASQSYRNRALPRRLGIRSTISIPRRFSRNAAATSAAMAEATPVDVTVEIPPAEPFRASGVLPVGGEGPPPMSMERVVTFGEGPLGLGLVKRGGAVVFSDSLERPYKEGHHGMLAKLLERAGFRQKACHDIAVDAPTGGVAAGKQVRVLVYERS